jgi:stress-induced morphogen
MAIEKASLELLIREKFPSASIKITDLVGDQDHYQLEISCESFAGKSRVAQHQMVNKALAGCLGAELHALSIKTKVKE